MPTLGEWSGSDVSLGEVERAIAEVRRAEHDGATHGLRTSVLTHIAWVPREWEAEATETRAGLGGRHPSRAIVLLPDPDADVDRIDARVSIECFDLPGIERTVAAEVIELRLLGNRCVAPASVVAPLLMADLPVFLRWRGRPPFSGEAFSQLVDTVDRLIVDSGEWPDVPGAYGDLARLFERVACSDLAWRRTGPWRAALAGLWPGIADVSELTVRGPAPEAMLLAGWLRARLRREVELVHEQGDGLREVRADGSPARPQLRDGTTPSDLLSAELDVLERDQVYEQAAAAAAGMPAPVAG